MFAQNLESGEKRMITDQAEHIVEEFEIWWQKYSSQLLCDTRWGKEDLKDLAKDVKEKSERDLKLGMITEIAEMEKCIHCLAIEVPGTIHSDVRQIWNKLKSKLI